MSAPTPEAVEAAAKVLYRQFRARHGFPPFFGEWDNAGSYQPRFRDDARAILAAAAHATEPTAHPAAAPVAQPTAQKGTPA